LVKAFLKAGVLSEDGIDHDTPAGTPQGGILSPLLANLASTVLDDYFDTRWMVHRNSWTRLRYRQRGGATYRLVRYADDFVVLVNGRREHAEAQWEEVGDVLSEVGLRLAVEKTRVVHIDEGFDFLGFRIQRHRQWGSDRRFVYSYPSAKSMAAIRGKVKAATGKRHKNQAAGILFMRLGYLIRGWCHYFRHGASTAAFHDLHHFLWRRMWIWLQKKHPKQGRKWIVRRYYRPGWWPSAGGERPFDPASVRIDRYRYRGHTIPTPWTQAAKAVMA
jgi:RNA-directed DNA polymerase